MIFKVSRETSPNKLAAAIINVTENNPIECLASGTQAVNNLLYALCVAGNVREFEHKITFEGEREGKFRVRITTKRSE